MGRGYNRRKFLGKSLAESGAAALGVGFDERALLSHQAIAAMPEKKKEPIKDLPKGKIGHVTISRIILVWQLLHSHFPVGRLRRLQRPAGWKM